MKLTLKNFRCYTNQTFEFTDDDVTLVSGPSGHGKTTILLAIQFALYGSVNHKYLVSHNKTSCEVILIYKNFKIKRTKRPNILNVEMNDKSYEDKEAQIVLNKYFGVTNSSIFFMDLSHLDKMEFLEKIVNANCDVKELKNKIKIELTSLNKELAILDGQISNTESMVDIIQKPEKVENPEPDNFFDESSGLQTLSKDDLILEKNQTIIQLDLKNSDETKYNRLMVEIRVIQEEIDSLGYFNPDIHSQIKIVCKELDSLKVQNNQMEKKRDKMLVVDESLKELKNFEHIDDAHIHILDQQLKTIDEKIEHCVRYEESQKLNLLKKEYLKALELEREEWHHKTEQLQNKLNKLNIVGKSILNNLSLFEQIQQKFQAAQHFNLKNNLGQIEAEIEALKMKFLKSFKCGNCDHKLIINMDTFELVQTTKDNQEKLDTKCDFTIKTKLQKLENLKDKLDSNNIFLHETNIEEIMDKITLINAFNNTTTELKQLGSFKLSISLKNMERKIGTIDSCEVEENHEIGDLNTLKDERRDLTIQHNEISQQLKIKKNLLKKTEIMEYYDFSIHKSIIDSIERHSEALKLKTVELEKYKTSGRLQTKLESLNFDLDQLQHDPLMIPQLQQTLKNIELGLQYHEYFNQYKTFHIQLKKYKKVKTTLNNFKDNKKNMEQTYLKTLLFKQKVIEAEHESLQFMVNTINTHLSVLLQDFFSESFGDPIQIYLELSNEKRPQVNTVINYKGNKVDYKSLSTGEYARVKLAFDLTFKEILGENIIMLDECTANLDQDLSTKIFNKIKGTFPSKTILIVAHQVIMGTFDHVLKL
jgi:DNA repair exonuclease SbcCD ATPase subunit